MPRVTPALLVILGLAGLVSACEVVPTAPQVPQAIAQDWVCGREYVNHAWGYVRSGTVIDREGHVWRYNSRSTPNAVREIWSPKDPSHLTGADLKARYAGATKVDIHVAPADLVQRLPAIADAASGKLTEPRVTAADMGSFVSYCLMPDTQGETFRQVVLEQHGDLTITNTSASAQALLTWLATVLGKDGDS